MKLFFKVLLVLFFLALLGVAYVVVFANEPRPFPSRSESAARLSPGPWSVGHFEQTWVDSSRPTQANGDFAGERQRTLVGEVWYPDRGEFDDGATGEDPSPPGQAASPSFPLLVFSHGFTSVRQNGRYLGEHLASHGFVVIAVDYPLTSMSAPGGPMVEDVVNQPGDVSFLIDALLAASAQTGDPLSGKIDPERIGVLGISLGGLTSTLVGFHPDWKDPRIGAVLSIAGPMNFFTREFFAGSRTPFMMLAGDLDVLVPWESNAGPVPTKVPGGELLTVAGGSHTGFSGGTRWLRWMDNTDSIGCYSVENSIDAETREAGWSGLFGPAEAGINYNVADELCKVDPIPPAMNVTRQQMIAKVAVTAFFERYLADDARRRREAGRFLEREIETELREVDYRRSRLPPIPEPTADEEEDALTDAERRLINLLFDQSVNPNNEARTGSR